MATFRMMDEDSGGGDDYDPEQDQDERDSNTDNLEDRPDGNNTFKIGNLERPGELDRQTAFDEDRSDVSRDSELYRGTNPASSRDDSNIFNSGDLTSSSPTSNTFSVGFSKSSFVAFGLGAGVDLGENWRAHKGAEVSIDAYAVAGPIIALPLPLPLPSLNVSLSAPTTKGFALEKLDCSALVMAATPLFSLQATFDPHTAEFRSLTFSLGLGLQVGIAGGVFCGIGFK